jgi:hypothetical protein
MLNISLNDCRRYPRNAVVLKELRNLHCAAADSCGIEEVEEDDCSSNFVARNKSRTEARYSSSIVAHYSPDAAVDYNRSIVEAQNRLEGLVAG